MTIAVVIYAEVVLAVTTAITIIVFQTSTSSPSSLSFQNVERLSLFANTDSLEYDEMAVGECTMSVSQFVSEYSISLAFIWIEINFQSRPHNSFIHSL